VYSSTSRAASPGRVGSDGVTLPCSCLLASSKPTVGRLGSYGSANSSHALHPQNELAADLRRHLDRFCQGFERIL
jgi:hypothetical protein